MTNTMIPRYIGEGLIVYNIDNAAIFVIEGQIRYVNVLGSRPYFVSVVFDKWCQSTQFNLIESCHLTLLNSIS